jgi:hypothetical protein
MANNFDSNITRKLARVFLEKFELKRVISKKVNTQFLSNAFNPSTGDTVDIKRPTDYKSTRTADGDISATTAQSIITGKASATVQDYITVEVDYKEADQAIKMDQLDQLLEPAATRIVNDLETDFAAFAMVNTALLSGTPGTAVASWDDVANAGAVLETTGVPMDSNWCYLMNPFTQRTLASEQKSLGGPDARSTSALDQATVATGYAGMDVFTSNALATYTTSAGADRAGTLSANPTVTYVAAKDTMTQTLAVTGFEANLPVKAGETIQIAGRNRLNLATRNPIIDGSGNQILFTGTVTEDVTLGASGEGNIVATGPAIYEAAGAYNTVDSAPVSGDVVTLLGAASTLVQPQLFFHRNAFAIGSVPIEKLYSTDTLATTEDGIQIRVSKGASIRENKQIVRFDLRPAYGTFNPLFAGQAHGL